MKKITSEVDKYANRKIKKFIKYAIPDSDVHKVTQRVMLNMLKDFNKPKKNIPEIEIQLKENYTPSFTKVSRGKYMDSYGFIFGDDKKHIIGIMAKGVIMPIGKKERELMISLGYVKPCAKTEKRSKKSKHESSLEESDEGEELDAEEDSEASFEDVMNKLSDY